jgi:hypothetical protein
MTPSGRRALTVPGHGSGPRLRPITAALVVIWATCSFVAELRAQDAPTTNDAVPMSDPLAIRLTELTASLVTTAEPAIPVTIMYITQEGTSAYPAEIPVETGRCYSFAAIGEESAQDIDLHVYARGVEVVAHTGLDNTPIVHWCNEVFTEVSVEIRMFRGTGRFAFQAFRDLAGPPAATPPSTDISTPSRSRRQGYLPAVRLSRGLAHAGRRVWL